MMTSVLPRYCSWLDQETPEQPIYSLEREREGGGERRERGRERERKGGGREGGREEGGGRDREKKKD